MSQKHEYEPVLEDRFIDSERRFVIDFAHGLQPKFNNPQDS
jgi:hypothetical protein